jgi:hypothetical protein
MEALLTIRVKTVLQVVKIAISLQQTALRAITSYSCMMGRVLAFAHHHVLLIEQSMNV